MIYHQRQTYKSKSAHIIMSLSRYSGYNDPFYNFFGNINREVEDMNNLFGDPFFHSSWGYNNNPKQHNRKDSKDVTKTSNNNKQKSIFAPLGSLINDSSFNSLITPPIDVRENEKSYNLQVSVPGAPKDKIKVDFNKDTNELSIAGEIPETVNEKKEGDKVVYSERSFGQFSRSLTLPENVDGEQIQASFENGILHLSIPKVARAFKEKNNLHRIEIGSFTGSATDIKCDSKAGNN